MLTDSLVHDHEALKLLVEVIGEDKVILGTDVRRIKFYLNTKFMLLNFKYFSIPSHWEK